MIQMQKGHTVFSVWWDSLITTLYGDEFSQTKLPLALPEDWAMLEDMQKDSAKFFADNINTTAKRGYRQRYYNCI